MGTNFSSAQVKDMLFSGILSTTQTSIFWKDSERRFLGANRAFLDYYGFPDEKFILGKTDEDMGWHPDPDPYRNDEVRVLKEGISTYRVHGKCMARGEVRDIVASKSPLIVEGQIVGLVGSFEDVTDEVRQQEEIARLNVELEKRIKAHDRLMSISDVGIVKINLADYTFAEYNDAMYRMIGYTREEYEQKFRGRLELYFAGEYAEELEKLKAAADAALKEKRKTFSLNMKIPSRTGFCIVGGAASFGEAIPETGRPDCMYMVYRDITEILETQKKLAAAEAEAEKSEFLMHQNKRMQRMLDGVPAGMGAVRIINGVPDTMIQLNQFFFDRVALKKDENNTADLHHFLECIHPDDRERYKEGFYRLLEEKHPISEQFRVLSAVTGRYYWVNVRGSVYYVSEEKQIAYFAYDDIDYLKKTETELRKSHSLYERTVDTLQVGLWYYDIPSHCITLGSNASTEALRKKFGWPRVFENAPESTLCTIEPEDRDKYLEAFRKIDAGQDATVEVWYRNRPGVEPYCEREAYHVEFDENGKPVRALGIGQNITAEKKVKERYEREMHYLRHNSDESLIAKGHYNLTQNKVLEYESSMKQGIYTFKPGISYDEAYEGMLGFSYSAGDRAEVADKLNREKLISRYQHGEMHTTLEYRRIVNGGYPLWISMTVHTYMMPETGDLELFSYAYNITEHKLIDTVMGVISNVEFDYIGLIHVKSNQFEFLKKSPEILFPGVRVQTDYDSCCAYVRKNFVNEEEVEQFNSVVSLDNILGVLEKNEKYTATYRRTEAGAVLCKQLDYTWFDRELGMIVVVRSDVTAAFRRDQIQLARIEAAKLEAEKANEEKSAFLSSMSHDMRTPLNGVLSFTGFALKERDPEKKQKYLEKIDASGKLLMDLVSDTLDLSRLESGKAVLEPEAVMPDELVSSVITSLQPSAELKNIHMETDVCSADRSPLWCDKLKVQKIVLNLVSNAIKYTHAGGKIRVEQSYSGKENAAGNWKLVVEDNGMGMSEEFMKRMYEPFSQEKRSESVNTPGTGLGLSIIKKYVDLMRGSISVKSKIHEGTRWVVTLPIGKADAHPLKDRGTELHEELLFGKRVLLCEDNYMNTEIATMLLREKKVDVDAAENGKAGVDRFLASPAGYYNAVLMDIRMPVMDGLTAVQKIRSSGRPDAETVPVLALTADAFEESIQEARKAGMNDYVLKPIEPEKLYRALILAVGTKND